MARTQGGPASGSSGGGRGDTTSRFGEGSVFSGEFFRGPLVVSDDPNIQETLGLGPSGTFESHPHVIDVATPAEQFDDTRGGGIVDVALLGRENEGFLSAGQSFQAGVEGAQQTAQGASEVARNIGPDYLDELTAVAIPLVILVALAWLLRPFAKLLG